MNATEHIWYEYRIKLSAFIRSKVTEDSVDDILQDVFMKIHTRINSLHDDTKIESWLYQITRHTIIDHYRSRRTTEELPDWLEQAELEEEASNRKALSSCLAPMVKQLPDKYRSAIEMSEIENRTQQELAEQESISLSGAKSRVQRGRALLKAMLYDCCQFELNKHDQIVTYEKKVQGCKNC